MENIYYILGFIAFWVILIALFLFLLTGFWIWNKDRGTKLYQLYDYLIFLVRYDSYDDDQIVAMFDAFEAIDDFKNRVGGKHIYSKLKKDAQAIKSTLCDNCSNVSIVIVNSVDGEDKSYCSECYNSRK